jgi:hypothetical protein
MGYVRRASGTAAMQAWRGRKVIAGRDGSTCAAEVTGLRLLAVTEPDSELGFWNGAVAPLPARNAGLSTWNHSHVWLVGELSDTCLGRTWGARGGSEGASDGRTERRLGATARPCARRISPARSLRRARDRRWQRRGRVRPDRRRELRPGQHGGVQAVTEPVARGTRSRPRGPAAARCCRVRGRRTTGTRAPASRSTSHSHLQVYSIRADDSRTLRAR